MEMDCNLGALRRIGGLGRLLVLGLNWTGYGEMSHFAAIVALSRGGCWSWRWKVFVER